MKLKRGRKITESRGEVNPWGGAKGGMYKNDEDGGKKIDSVKVKSSLWFFLVFLSSKKHTINQCLLFLIIFFFHSKAK